jgi:hypothetical protein
MLSIGMEDQGVLARVPVALIAVALTELPKPEETSEKIGIAWVQVPDLGKVRITCVLRQDLRRKRLYWSALRADSV